MHEDAITPGEFVITASGRADVNVDALRALRAAQPLPVTIYREGQPDLTGTYYPDTQTITVDAADVIDLGALTDVTPPTLTRQQRRAQERAQVKTARRAGGRS